MTTRLGVLYREKQFEFHKGGQHKSLLPCCRNGTTNAYIDLKDRQRTNLALPYIFLAVPLLRNILMYFEQDVPCFNSFQVDSTYSA